MAWRVISNGAMLERKLGADPVSKKEKTSTQIYREGQIIDELESGFVERYDNNDETARALVERVADSGETDENGEKIWVAVGAPSEEPPAIDEEAAERALTAEAQVADLQAKVDQLEADLAAAQEGESSSSLSYSDLSKAALEAEVADQGLTATRADGKEGEPLKSDLVAALEGASETP